MNIDDLVRMSTEKFPNDRKKEEKYSIMLNMIPLIKPMFKDLFDAGYETVWIGTCKHWQYTSSSAIIGEPKITDDNDWPALWSILRNHGGMSCGNGLREADQAQSHNLFLSYFDGEYKKKTYNDILDNIELRISLEKL